MDENIEMKKDEAQNGGWPRARKILKRVGWVLLGLFAVMWAIGFFAPEFTEAIPERSSAWIQGKIEARKQAALDAEIEKLREKYKNDFDGGKTPEETLDLFIEALKAGDIEKASKYYVLEKQVEEFRSLREAATKDEGLQGNIDNLEAIRSDNKKVCGVNYNFRAAKGCTFTHSYTTTEVSTSTAVISGQTIVFVTPKGSNEVINFSVIENPYSHIWKVVY